MKSRKLRMPRPNVRARLNGCLRIAAGIAAKALFALAALTVLTISAGCDTTKYVFVDRGDLCKSWKHQTVSKDDKMTQPTAKIADGNNASRPVWGCKFGRNEAL